MDLLAPDEQDGLPILGGAGDGHVVEGGIRPADVPHSEGDVLVVVLVVLEREGGRVDLKVRCGLDLQGELQTGDVLLGIGVDEHQSVLDIEDAFQGVGLEVAVGNIAVCVPTVVRGYDDGPDVGGVPVVICNVHATRSVDGDGENTVAWDGGGVDQARQVEASLELPVRAVPPDHWSLVGVEQVYAPIGAPLGLGGVVVVF